MEDKDIRNIVYDVYEKAMGLSEFEWEDICKKYDLQCHPDTLRKAGVGIKLAAEAGALDFSSPEMREYDKTYKQKQMFYDQRREYNKDLREEARSDYYMGELVKAAQRANEVKPLVKREPLKWMDVRDERVEGLLVLSDIHYGLTTSNFWNEYNEDIADARLAKLMDRVIEKISTHKISVMHICLAGDQIAGAVHVANRVKSQDDVVDQLIKVSEKIAEFIANISLHVEDVKVYTTFGNHSRLVADLKASIHSDNLELFIPFWLEQRFQNNDNIIIVPCTQNELVSVKPCGVPCAIVHGDLDNDASAPTTAAMMYMRAYGEQLRYLFTGHLHHIHAKEQFDVEQIGCGSLCGVEDYAKGKRLFSKPSQCFCVFTPEGLDSVHHIDLSMR